MKREEESEGRKRGERMRRGKKAEKEVESEGKRVYKGAGEGRKRGRKEEGNKGSYQEKGKKGVEEGRRGCK